MFRKLTDFKYKRTDKEAFGFYLASLIFLLLLLSAIGVLGYLLPIGWRGFFYVWYRYKLGEVSAIIASLTLSLIIIIKKNLTGNYRYLLLVIASGVLGAFGGLILGLIPAAYLTKMVASEKK